MYHSSPSQDSPAFRPKKKGGVNRNIKQTAASGGGAAAALAVASLVDCAVDAVESK